MELTRLAARRAGRIGRSFGRGAALLALLLIVPSAHGRDESAAFWEWVLAHLDALEQIKTSEEPIADDLSEHLKRVDPGLTFEVGVGTRPFELIVSADGDKKLFPVVKRLVAAAPKSSRLKAIAFRPRHDPGYRIKVGPTELGAKDIRFDAQPDSRPGLIALTLYVRGLTQQNRDAILQAGFLLLDGLLGEYDMETKIGGIDWKPDPAKPDRPLRTLDQLPRAVDAWKG